LFSSDPELKGLSFLVKTKSGVTKNHKRAAIGAFSWRDWALMAARKSRYRAAIATLSPCHLALNGGPRNRRKKTVFKKTLNVSHLKTVVCFAYFGRRQTYF